MAYVNIVAHVDKLGFSMNIKLTRDPFHDFFGPYMSRCPEYKAGHRLVSHLLRLAIRYHEISRLRIRKLEIAT